MESVSGESECSKRICTNATSPSSPIVQPQETKPSPPELWNKILLTLWYNEEDMEALQTCRLVSKSWRELVDKMPHKFLWNPWLNNAQDLSFGFLFNSKATNFGEVSDVTKFAKLPPSEKNPFPHNRTVRLKMCGQDRETEEELAQILKKYGHHIHKLFYSPIYIISKRLTSFTRLLQTMENLQTLILDMGCLTTDMKKLINSEEYPPNLNRLCEVVIGDTKPEQTIAQLSIHYGTRIKLLTISCLSHSTIRNVLEKFQNLESIKVETFIVKTLSLDRFSRNGWPNLKRIALGIRDMEDRPISSIAFTNALRFVSIFSSTLELFSLDVGKVEEAAQTSLWSTFLHGDEDDDEAITPFPQLKELILPFRFVNRGQEGTETLESRFRFQFPSLKTVILQDVLNEFHNEDLHETRLREICELLWTLVPPSVQIIGVRTNRRNKHLARDFPVVYTCSRDSIR